MIKKAAGIAVLLLTFVLAACGKGEEAQRNVKEHVYRAEEILIPEIEDKTMLQSMSVRGDRMYLVGYTWGEHGSSINIVNRKTDGSDSSAVTVKLKENDSLDYILPDDTGSYYAILTENLEDDSDPENYVWSSSFYLVKLDAEGKEVWRQPLGENDSTGDSYYVAYAMHVLDDGRILLLDGNGLSFYDTQGKLLKTVSVEEDLSSSTLYILSDGSPVVNYYNMENGKYAMRRLDLETGKLSEEEYVIPGSGNSYTCYPGIGWDFLLMGNAGVYGYNLGDSEVTELLNIIDSDLSSSYIYNIVAIDARSFYGMMNDEQTGNAILLRFTKVDPEDVVDKKVLTLGCHGLDWDIRTQVVSFNKENKEYRIKIEDYSLYNTDEDYTAGIARLNTDIASGKIPDILILQAGSGMPVDSYVSKGLFENLYPYMDKDEELSREDYLKNVLEAYETDGKLYRLVPSFVIQTVAGKTADVGTEPGWTLDELLATMEKKPEGTKFFSDMTRNSLLNYCLQMSGSQYVNWETGECRFNSEAFLKFLKFMKQFPDQLEEMDYDMEYYNNYNVQWRNGTVLLSTVWLDSFGTYNHMKKGTYGEEITLIGFPAEEGKGAVIMPNLDMAMAASSKNKEGVWQFMRRFLLKEYQDKVSYGWPIHLKSIDVLKEKAQKRESYEDENGNLIEYDPEYNLGDITIAITPLTEEEVNQVFDYLSSVDQAYSYDANLVNIIEEEAAPFFSGQKTEKEAADIIQSRVQIYVNENR